MLPKFIEENDTRSIQNKIVFKVMADSPAKEIDKSPPHELTKEEFYQQTISGNPSQKDFVQRVCELTDLYFKHFDEGRPSNDSVVDTLLNATQSLLKASNYKRLKMNQVFAVIATLTKPHNKGLMMQIATGEGKSVISRLIAACLAQLHQQQVDVITSASNLAEREATESQGFYKGCGLSVESCIGFRDKYREKDKLDQNNIYATSNVLIGTIHEFCFNRLSGQLSTLRYDPPADKDQTHKGKHYTECRPNAFLILDEADTGSIDDKQNNAQITTKRSSLNKFDLLSMQIWNFVQTLLPEDDNIDLEQSISKIIEHIESCAEVQKILSFNEKDKEKWDLIKRTIIESAISARFYYKDKADYIVNRGKIEIVDKDSTGEIKHNSRWQHYLHEFLEMKHGLEVSRTTPPMACQTVPGFIDRYGSKVVGMTGTLGSEENIRFLEEAYNVVCVKVQKNNKDRKIIYEPIIINPDDQDDFKNMHVSKELFEFAKLQIKEGRSCLIVSKTINEAEKMMQDLPRMIKEETGIIIRSLPFFMSDVEDLHSTVETVDSNTIIFATALAGRGTDIKLTPQVKAAGGLATIITYVPDSVRTQNQIEGRSARNGDNGCTIMIITNYLGQRCFSASHCIQVRDKIEQEKVKRDLDVIKKIREEQQDLNKIENAAKEFIDKDQQVKYRRFTNIMMTHLDHKTIAEDCNNLVGLAKLENIDLAIDLNKKKVEIGPSAELSAISSSDLQSMLFSDNINVSSLPTITANISSAMASASFGEKKQLALMKMSFEINCDKLQDAAATRQVLAEAETEEATVYMATAYAQEVATQKRHLDVVAKELKAAVKKAERKSEAIEQNSEAADASQSLSSQLLQTLNNLKNGLIDDGVCEKFYNQLKSVIPQCLENITSLQSGNKMLDNLQKKVQKALAKCQEDYNKIKSVVFQVFENNVKAHNENKQSAKLRIAMPDGAEELTEVIAKKNEEKTGILGYVLGGIMVLSGAALICFTPAPIVHMIAWDFIKSGACIIAENYDMNQRGRYDAGEIVKSTLVHTVANVAGSLVKAYINPKIMKFAGELANKLSLYPEVYETFEKLLKLSTKRSNMLLLLYNALGKEYKAFDKDFLQKVGKQCIDEDQPGIEKTIKGKVDNHVNNCGKAANLGKQLKDTSKSMTDSEIFSICGLTGTVLLHMDWVAKVDKNTFDDYHKYFESVTRYAESKAGENLHNIEQQIHSYLDSGKQLDAKELHHSAVIKARSTFSLIGKGVDENVLICHTKLFKDFGDQLSIAVSNAVSMLNGKMGELVASSNVRLEAIRKQVERDNQRLAAVQSQLQTEKGQLEATGSALQAEVSTFNPMTGNQAALEVKIAAFNNSKKTFEDKCQQFKADAQALEGLVGQIDVVKREHEIKATNLNGKLKAASTNIGTYLESKIKDRVWNAILKDLANHKFEAIVSKKLFDFRSFWNTKLNNELKGMPEDLITPMFNLFEKLLLDRMVKQIQENTRKNYSRLFTEDIYKVLNASTVEYLKEMKE